MNTKQKIILRLEDEIRQRQEQIEKVLKLKGLEDLELDAYFFNGESIDFDHRTHEDVIKIIKAVGGDWEKTPSGEGKVDYVTKKDGVTLRCYQGAPPPNCKIVEYLEEIPAQPARLVTKRKMVCQ